MPTQNAYFEIANESHLQFDAKKKECDTMQCDREVALLALKQSIEMSGEPLQRELNTLKVNCGDYLITVNRKLSIIVYIMLWRF